MSRDKLLDKYFLKAILSISACFLWGWLIYLISKYTGIKPVVLALSSVFLGVLINYYLSNKKNKN